MNVPAVRLIPGDCTEIMPALFEEGLRADAMICDPPYHLASIVDRLGSSDAAPIQSGATGVYARSSSGFMGQQWDGGDVAFQAKTWRHAFNLLRPGAHLVAFGGTRTYHRMACAIEDAGFEIRDQLAWIYGTGFPKSHNLDGEWDGWGSALKPAWEPIVLARKPMIGSIPDNVSVFGTGALNIDACRIHTEDELRAGAGGIPARHDPATSRKTYTVKRLKPGATMNREGGNWRPEDEDAVLYHGESKPGRWPANLVHDGSDEVLDAFAAYGQRGALAPVHIRSADKTRNTFGAFNGNVDHAGSTFRGDSGTAARFFYSAKATAEDRCGSAHPTVKPVALMRWLVRMITPPGGLIIDCFAGTGTTGAAARAEGFQSLLIEREDEYLGDICRRLGIDRTTLESATVNGRPVRQNFGPLFGGAAA